MKQIGITFLLIVTAMRPGGAQTVKLGLGDGKTPLALAPGSPDGSYALSSFESVNLYAGKVGIAVPLLSIGGRGTSGYSIMAAAPSRSWTVQVVSNLGLCEENFCQYAYSAHAVLDEGGSPYKAQYGPGMAVVKYTATDLISCTPYPSAVMGTTFTHVVFIAPDGTEHPLFEQVQGGSALKQHTCSAVAPLSRGTVFVAHDDSGMEFHTSTVITDDVSPASYITGANYLLASGTLFLRDGTRYLVVDGTVREIVDRNGNRTTFTYATNSGSGGPALGSVYVSTITDPIGREYKIAYDVTASTAGVDPLIAAGCGLDFVVCDHIGYKGEGEATRSIIVRHTPLSSRLRSDHTLPVPPLRLFPQLSTESNVWTATRIVGDRLGQW